MNIQTPLGNVPHLNVMLNVSLEIFPKRSINCEKKKIKIQTTWGTIVILEILNAVYKNS